MDLNNAQEMVAEFHQHIGAPIAEAPRLLPCRSHAARWLAMQIDGLAKVAAHGADGTTDLLLSRTALALEELAEWLTAHAEGDLVAAADAVGDRCYVLVGDSIAAGLPLAEIFAEVHESNMSKLRCVTTGHGKAAKGAEFKPPQITQVL